MPALVWDSSAVSDGCFFQRNDRANKWLQTSSIKQLCNFKQLLLVGFDDKERILHTLVKWSVRIAGKRYPTMAMATATVTDQLNLEWQLNQWHD